jgi:ferrous iron transport protein A
MPVELKQLDRPAAPAVAADACPLCDVGVGRSGRITCVAGDPVLRRRLMEMGLCRGTRVEVVRRSPFGDPIELRLRGYCLSLRNEQARCVSVCRDD